MLQLKGVFANRDYCLYNLHFDSGLVIWVMLNTTLNLEAKEVDTYLNLEIKTMKGVSNSGTLVDPSPLGS